ncbi:hypothetical protein [Haloarchaeobius sp. DT45]|uniref:hypothetical protein n=1 Tax=Haloarchaeobius sp. DT45 TaxID=3446116 RepID=UPI003F6B7A67
MRPLSAATLTLVVLLAGCGGLADVEQTREPFAVDGTDYPTETAGTPTGAGPDLGFDPDPTANELGDVNDMVSAQQRVLRDTSYRVEYLLEATHANGTTLVRQHSQGAFTANESHYFVDVRTGGTTIREPRHMTIYADGTKAFVRRTTANGTNVSIPGTEAGGDPVPPADMGVFRGRGQVASFLFQGFDGMNVTNVTELDRVPPGLEGPLYRVESQTVESPQLLAVGPNATVENASFEAIVDHRGFVYEYHLTFETETDAGEPVFIERRLVYRDLGHTTLTRPDWVDEYTADNVTTTTT